MQSIKFIVIFLGILILIGFSLLVFGFAKKFLDPNWQLFTKTSSAPRVFSKDKEKKSFGDIFLNLQKDHIIKEALTSDPLVIIVTGPSSAGPDKIFVFDTNTGNMLGTISP